MSSKRQRIEWEEPGCWPPTDRRLPPGSPSVRVKWHWEHDLTSEPLLFQLQSGTRPPTALRRVRRDDLYVRLVQCLRRGGGTGACAILLFAVDLYTSCPFRLFTLNCLPLICLQVSLLSYLLISSLITVWISCSAEWMVQSPWSPFGAMVSPFFFFFFFFQFHSSLSTFFF